MACVGQHVWAGQCGRPSVFGQGGTSALDVLLNVCSLAGGLDFVDVPQFVDKARASALDVLLAGLLDGVDVPLSTDNARDICQHLDVLRVDVHYFVGWLAGYTVWTSPCLTTSRETSAGSLAYSAMVTSRLHSSSWYGDICNWTKQSFLRYLKKRISFTETHFKSLSSRWKKVKCSSGR